MLTTLAALQLTPASPPTNPVWLNQLLVEADSAIKTFIGFNPEWTSYPGVGVSGGTNGDSGFYSGQERTDIVIRQYPLLLPSTAIAVGSNGAGLPQSTINVASTIGFNPDGGTFTIVLGGNANPAAAAIKYTGLTSTSFTGCTTQSTGTLATSQQVWGIALWFNQQGYGGQGPNAFTAQTLLTPGQAFMVPTTREIPCPGGTVPMAGSGLIRRLGNQAFFGGGWPGGFGGWNRNAKLSATQLSSWPFGYQNIQVAYQAGYPVIPSDLAFACQLLVQQMVINLPFGGALQSQTLGAWSYSLLAQAAVGQMPQLATVATILRRYRDISFGTN